MKSERHRLRLLRVEPVPHDRPPEAAGGPELRDLLEQVDVGVEKERDLRGDRVDVEAPGHRLIEVRDPVRQGEPDLLHRRRAGLADVVSAHADRVPSRHLPRTELNHIEGEAHRGPRRIDVRGARDVFLEDVVLDRPPQRLPADAPALGDGDVEGEQDRRGRVDRHARADAVEGQAVEEQPHVLDRRDRHADAPDLASSEGRIAVVSHLRRQVEGHTQALVAMLEEIPESPVRLLRGPEARVLAHGPEAAAVHRGPRAAGEGWLAGESERLREVRGRAMGRRHDDVQGEVAAGFARRGQ